MNRLVIAMSLVLFVGCEKENSTTPPEPSAAATPSTTEEAPAEGGLSGVGHCCKSGSCVGKEYHSAHAFAVDCSDMGATEARWCASSCELVEEPYACNCPE
ncbi:MAG: hypothetical protein AAF721_32235 [Myxococcota bacterium]